MSKILVVTGIQCAGKTTLCANLAEEMVSKNESRPIIVGLGTFLRKMFGEKFFTDTEYAAAPQVLDHMVKNIVYNAIQLGIDLEKDVILDGFPRKINQLEWLLYSSNAADNKIPVSVVFVVPENEDTLRRRLLKRLKESEIEGYVNSRVKTETEIVKALKEKAVQMCGDSTICLTGITEHVSLGV